MKKKTLKKELDSCNFNWHQAMEDSKILRKQLRYAIKQLRVIKCELEDNIYSTEQICKIIDETTVEIDRIQIESYKKAIKESF